MFPLVSLYFSCLLVSISFRSLRWMSPPSCGHDRSISTVTSWSPQILAMLMFSDKDLCCWWCWARLPSESVVSIWSGRHPICGQCLRSSSTTRHHTGGLQWCYSWISLSLSWCWWPMTSRISLGLRRLLLLWLFCSLHQMLNPRQLWSYCQGRQTLRLPLLRCSR